MKTNTGLKDFAGSSRVWIFGPEKKLSVEELALLNRKLDDFAKSWISHQNKLKSAGLVLYDHFAVLVVDNSLHPASGCSMDTLYRFISTLNIEFETDFLNRKIFRYLDPQRELQLIRQEQLENALANGVISRDTLFFDNLVDQLHELEHNWIKPYDQFWIGKLA